MRTANKQAMEYILKKLLPDIQVLIEMNAQIAHYANILNHVDDFCKKSKGLFDPQMFKEKFGKEKFDDLIDAYINGTNNFSQLASMVKKATIKAEHALVQREQALKALYQIEKNLAQVEKSVFSEKMLRQLAVLFDTIRAMESDFNVGQNVKLIRKLFADMANA